MKKIFKKLAVLAAAIVAAFGAFSAPVSAFAEETATETTSVMEDLQSDATFSKDAYPGKTVDELKGAGEELLKVIRIGESVNAELYVYVYQPSDETKEIEAAKILIGQTASESSARVYPLTLVSSEGVFDKYRVDGLEVLSSFAVRHYTITSLYRPFDKALDEEKSNGGDDPYIAEPVAQTWYVRNTDDGRIEYAHTEDEVITVIDEYHGHLLFFPKVDRAQQSFFLAFTTDRRMDDLKRVEMTYEGKNTVFMKKLIGDDITKTVGSFSPKYLKITEEDRADNGASNLWWDKYYEWDRIGTIDSFLNDDGHELSSEAITNLNRVKQTASENNTTAFVLRYMEHDAKYKYDNKYGNCIGYVELIEVTNVCLLKLTFETAGVPYTMGVVDSMTTPDNVPDGGGVDPGLFPGIKEQFNNLQKTLRTIGIAVGACFGIGLVALATYGIVTLINWIRDGRRRGGSSGG